MPDIIPAQIKRRFLWAAGGLAAVLLIGTVGYRVISCGRSSLVDCFYMTFITIATIGYGEIVDLSGNPLGRIFTIFIGLAGIGGLTYILMSITAFVVEGHMNEAFRRRRMEKIIEKYNDHYIVCGLDGPGIHIAQELRTTGRPFVIVEADRARIDRMTASHPETVYIEGDPTDNATLLNAGVAAAKGLFAVTGDDNVNLVASLTAKQINPRIRVVGSCLEVKNVEKMKKAGADSVVSPTFIGGLRMASEMIRPTVVTFLDVMMSRKDESLRVEELAVPESIIGKPLSSLNFRKFKHLLLLAVKSREGGWVYNPSREYVMKPGDVLIFMSTPQERQELEALFHPAG